MTDDEAERAASDDPDFAGDFDWENAVVVLPEPKQSVSIRLDREVLDFFKARGRGYQTRINAVLRAYVEAQKAS